MFNKGGIMQIQAACVSGAQKVYGMSHAILLYGERGGQTVFASVHDIDRKSTRLNSSHSSISYAFFFFNDTATTEIYTLSLHDALPIYRRCTECHTRSCCMANAAGRQYSLQCMT